MEQNKILFGFASCFIQVWNSTVRSYNVPVLQLSGTSLAVYGPREILAKWTMGNVLRFWLKTSFSLSNERTRTLIAKENFPKERERCSVLNFECFLNSLLSGLYSWL